MATNESLLTQIESISCDGLDPLHSPESLVLKMRAIYKLAAMASSDVDADDVDDDE